MALNKRSLGALALLLGSGVVLAVIGRWLLFTTFMIYDDEGYVLYSLRNYVAHGDLYARVYSQYGPFFYNLYDTIQRVLPLEYDNVSGRWITLVNWLAAAGAGGLLAWRYSRSTVYTLFTLGMTFFCLWVMKSEPMHPGSLLTALVAIGAVAGAIAIEREKPVAFAVGAALVGVALVLTKINVGVFFLVAAGGWLLVNTAIGKDRKLASWLVALGCAALPFLLMRSLWEATWVRTFALIVTTSSLGLVLVLHRSRRDEHDVRTWGWFVGCGAAWTLAIGALTCLRGTGVTDLIHGVILGPLKHPGVYSLPMTWRPASAPLAVGSFAFALWFYTRNTRPAWVPTLIAALRFGILGWFLLSGQVLMGRFCELYGLPLLWLLVTPLQPGEISARDRARIWVAWVLVFQSLHAYPVAGSQVNWGTGLFPAVLAMGVYEAAAYFQAMRPAWRRWLVPGVGALLLIPLGWITFTVGKTCHARFYESAPLGLHGAEEVRMAEDFTDTLQIITRNLQLHAGTLFSFPGLYSMNIWTGKPTPTLANATHWFTLLSPQEQQAIIDRLEADPKACVIVQRMVVDFLEINGFSTKCALRDYLMREFTPALKLDGYAIWIHKQRTIAPVDIVSIQQIGPGPRLRMEGVVPVGTQPIGRIELRNYMTEPRVIQDIALPAANMVLTTTPVDAAPSLVRFSLEFTAAFNHLNPHEAFVVLKSADGRELARLRFAH